MMHMWFWCGTNLGSFLFSGYNVTTTWSLVSTCLGLAALAILYEGMKLLQIKLHQRFVIVLKRPRLRTSENSSLLSKISPRSLRTSFSTPWYYLRFCNTTFIAILGSNILIIYVSSGSWLPWMLQVAHSSLHTLLGYMLMMAVMTYNVYIAIALVIGGGLGYWIFGPKLIQLNMARFHEKQRILECDNECAVTVNFVMILFCAENAVNHRRQSSTVSMVAQQLVTEATVEVHAPNDNSLLA